MCGVILNLSNKTLTGGTGANDGVNAYGTGGPSCDTTVINGNIANFARGINVSSFSYATINGNILKNNSLYGFRSYAFSSDGVSFNDNISCCNTSDDLRCEQTPKTTGSGNKLAKIHAECNLIDFESDDCTGICS